MSIYDMKVYIAAPFFNEDQVKIVESIEAALDKAGIEYFSPRSAGTLMAMSKGEQALRRRDIYMGNITAMENCTHMVACIEHKDTGTTFEIGYYAAIKRPIVLFHADPGRVNVMLAEAAFTVCDRAEMVQRSLVGRYHINIEDLT